MKAIETIYNGYRFRSRLEARWAVFFDAAGIRYEYEPEGFECKPFGEKTYRYLPDFYLPDFKVYAEVKPNKEHLLTDAEKIACCIDFCATPISEGLIILGQIPHCNEPLINPIPRFNYLYWNKGVCSKFCVFLDNFNGRTVLYKSNYIHGSASAPDFPELFVDNDNLYGWARQDSIHMALDGIVYVLPEFTKERTSERLNRCCLKARQARFEHGEKPI